MYEYNCPDCNETKLQTDKNARKINEVIDQVNALIQVNNETVDFIEEKANEVVEEIAEREVNEVLGDLRTELDDIENEINSNILKGFSLCPQLNYNESMITFQTIIDKMLSYGADTVIITYNIKLGYRTIPSFYTQTYEISDEILNYCKTKDFKKIIVKAHTLPENDDNIEPIDAETWFNEYNSIIDNLCAKGITDLIIHNEADRVTSPKYDSYWLELISRVKSKEISVGTSLTYYQCSNFNLFDSLDWIGINLYPRLGKTTDSKLELSKSLYYDLYGRNLIGLCHDLKLNYNKPIYITEIGTSSLEGALADPSLQKGNTSEHEQAVYYDIILSNLLNCSDIDEITLFSANGTVYKFIDKEAENIVKKYYGGK